MQNCNQPDQCFQQGTAYRLYTVRFIYHVLLTNRAHKLVCTFIVTHLQGAYEVMLLTNNENLYVFENVNQWIFSSKSPLILSTNQFSYQPCIIPLRFYFRDPGVLHSYQIMNFEKQYEGVLGNKNARRCQSCQITLLSGQATLHSILTRLAIYIAMHKIDI